MSPLFTRKKPDAKDKKEAVSEKSKPSEKNSTKAEQASGLSAPGFQSIQLSSVLIQPHITEKTLAATEKGVYTFVVKKNASKQQVAKAIESIYNVTVEQVRIINTPSKTRRYRFGHHVRKPGLRKAMAMLKKGEKIDTFAKT